MQVTGQVFDVRPVRAWQPDGELALLLKQADGTEHAGFLLLCVLSSEERHAAEDLERGDLVTVYGDLAFTKPPYPNPVVSADRVLAAPHK